MFNPTQVVIEAFVRELRTMYVHTYSVLEPTYPDVIAFIGRAAMENIANSDAPYHNAEHTMMVTLVGQEILRGKHIREGGVSPRDWLNFIISLLCHDIGYVRGICLADRPGHYVSNDKGDLVEVHDGATDASMTPYHVTRSKVFVRERLGSARLAHFDTLVIQRNIEHTRFPVPDQETHADTADYPGLVRAADLIGQLADVNYVRKIPALFAEFNETGANQKLGYRTPADLRAKYPEFFWTSVRPYIGDAMRYLSVTQEGKLWISNLYSHVFSQEHRHRLVDMES